MKYSITDILEYLNKSTGFNYSAYHRDMLERRITNRIDTLRAENVDVYYTLLTTDPEEPNQLIENFMINVSHFFRDPLSFEFLAKKIIPAIITSKIKKNDNTFRVWSAGCSRGEEAYSVAMILNQYLKNEKTHLSIDFFATDFKPGVIENARKGEYNVESVRDIKYGFLKDYFIETNKTFKVAPEIKSMVSFSVYDLLDKHSYAPSESVFGDFDLVLCRNVLIYFIPEFQELIFDKLYRSLAPKGILMLGETEDLIKDFRDKFRQVSDNCKIFEMK